MNAIRIRRRIDSEDLHLPELRPLLGRDVEIIVLDTNTEAAKNIPEPPLPRSDAAQSILDMFDALIARIPADVLDRLPRDGAEQHDHYLYGTPKRQAHRP